MGNIPTYKIKPVHSLYDDDAVRAIGEFFLACASAEAVLTMLLNRLLSHPTGETINGLAAITGMANKVMLEKISTTLGILAPEHHPEIDKLCEKIRAIFEHRNTIAHSTAVGGAGKKIVVTSLKLRMPPKLVEITYNPVQLRVFTGRLYQIVRHLSERLSQVGVVPSRSLCVPNPLVPVRPQHPDR